MLTIPCTNRNVSVTRHRAAAIPRAIRVTRLQKTIEEMSSASRRRLITLKAHVLHGLFLARRNVLPSRDTRPIRLVDESMEYSIGLLQP